MKPFGFGSTAVSMGSESTLSCEHGFVDVALDPQR